MAHMVREGETTSIALVTAAFDRIAETDGQLRAWVWLDRDCALAKANNLDQLRHSGRALGQMQGVPIGLKDIIDTADMPTEFVSSAFVDRQPKRDAVPRVAAERSWCSNFRQNGNNSLCFYGPC